MSDLSLGLLVAAVLVCGVVAIAVYVMRKVDSLTTRAANWITREWQSWQIRRDERKRRRTESLVSRHVDLATMALQCVGDRDREIAELHAKLAALQPAPQPAPQPTPQPAPQTAPQPGLLTLADAVRHLSGQVQALGASMDKRLELLETRVQALELIKVPQNRRGLRANLPPAGTPIYPAAKMP